MVANCLMALFIEAQINTQRYGRRPYGVGLLVAGFDVREYEHVADSSNISLLIKYQ